MMTAGLELACACRAPSAGSVVNFISKLLDWGPLPFSSAEERPLTCVSFGTEAGSEWQERSGAEPGPRVVSDFQENKIPSI